VEQYLLLSDTHLGLYGSNDNWHEIVLKLFQTIADFCVKNNVKKIIHLGDFFDNRKSLNVKTISYAIQIAKILNDFETYLLVGNHDTFFKNQIYPHSLVIFNEYDNINVIDAPWQLDGDIGLIPWRCGFGQIELPYLMGHFEINDFRMNSGYIMKRAELNRSDFNGFKQVISGHYHTPMVEDDINYIGAPYHQSFADVGERGFYLWSRDKDMQFIEYTDAPHFMKVTATESMTQNIDAPFIKGNIIKLIFEEDYGTVENNQIIENIQLLKPFLLYTDFSKLSADLGDEIVLDTTEMVNNQEIVRDFIEKTEVPKNLDKNVIISMIEKLMDEIVED
jgi:DNA repair exonuclease SbcCD nuclease subunit